MHGGEVAKQMNVTWNAERNRNAAQYMFAAVHAVLE